MNRVIDKGFRSCRFVSTIVKHPIHTIFSIGTDLKLSFVVECSVLPPTVTLLLYMTTLGRKHVSMNSILFDHNNYHYRNFNRSLKILIGSCCGSNLKQWLRLLFQPKIQIPAGVHCGTPAPWLSLMLWWLFSLLLAVVLTLTLHCLEDTWVIQQGVFFLHMEVLWNPHLDLSFEKFK